MSRYYEPVFDRKRDPASLQNRFCYTVEEIRHYMEGAVSPEKRSAIGVHLNIEKCQRCRQIFALIEIDGQERERVAQQKGVEYAEGEQLIECRDAEQSPEYGEVEHSVEYGEAEQKIFERIKNRKGAKRDRPVLFNVQKRVEKGQIWTTSPEPVTMQGEALETVDLGVPVLIVDSGSGDKKLSNIIRVMPLSFDTGFHLEGDTLFFDSSGALGYPFLVEIFNEIQMLAGNLGSFRATLAQADMDRVEQKLSQRNMNQHGMDQNRIALDKMDSCHEIERWQKMEQKLCHYLTRPVHKSLLKKRQIDIEVSEYKRAADDSGLSRVEEKAALISNDDYSFMVIQKRERLILRFDSSDVRPESVLLDGNVAQIEMSDYGEYDVEIGEAGYLPERMDVTLMVDDEVFEFQLLFHHNG